MAPPRSASILQPLVDSSENVIAIALFIGSATGWKLWTQRREQRQSSPSDTTIQRPATTISNGGNKQDDYDEFGDEDENGTLGVHHLDLSLRDPYVQRRISDRLSYTDLQDHHHTYNNYDSKNRSTAWEVLKEEEGDLYEEHVEDGNADDDSTTCIFDEDDVLWSSDTNWNHFEGYENQPHHSSQENDANHQLKRQHKSTPTATTKTSATEANISNHKTPAQQTPSSTHTRTTGPLRTSTTSTSTTTTVPRLHHPTGLTRPRRNAARQRYNTRILPHTVFMVRHGQSLGNVNEVLYATTADNAMPLTEWGWEQARAAGRHLREQLSSTTSEQTTAETTTPTTTPIHFIVSPYVRTWETLHGILSAWIDPATVVVDDTTDVAARSTPTNPNNSRRRQAWYAQLHALGLSWHEDPRIREQDFGNFQNPTQIRQAKEDRYRFGAFYYRFPHGESASDVRIDCIACCIHFIVLSPWSLTNRLSHSHLFCDRVPYVLCL